MAKTYSSDLNPILRFVTKFVRDARDNLASDPACAEFFDSSGRLEPTLALRLLFTAVEIYFARHEPKMKRKNGHPDSILYDKVIELIQRQYARSRFVVTSKRANFTRSLAKLLAATVLRDVGEHAAANRVWE